MNKKTVCIYHKNCFDGMAAALVIKKVYPDAEFISMNYGDKEKELSFEQDCYENANINDRYILVDFSLPRELMKLMANKAEMLVIDHHKTAKENCEGLPFCVFDMNMSGAELAWWYYSQEGTLSNKVPNLIKYIGDRDLWKFKLPNSEEINAYIQSYPIDINWYEKLLLELETPEGMEIALNAGKAISRYKEQLTNQICNTAKFMSINGFFVPVANSPILMSEVGHELCIRTYSQLGENKPAFGAYYFDRSDGYRQWGVRSLGDFDVSEIAKSKGGGGHKNAAGWQEKI
jgi:uncharacterized protein